MRGYLPVWLVIAVLALVPALASSNFFLNFMILSLLYGLLGQGWNLLGGYCGQFSFGHALFFGSGAYCTAILQVQWGWNAWAGFFLGVASGALVGALVGLVVFRYGLRGSYFALVTLAFAEVFRILANTLTLTGGGAGLLIPLNEGLANLQFSQRWQFYYLIALLVSLALLLTRWLERHRFGAYLVAIRANEDAARALGVDPFRYKLGAITLSGAVTAAGGVFYAQYFLYLDAGIGFGAAISVEALLVPIIGGMGTVFGPLLGSLVLHLLAELTRHYSADTPGLDLVVYGLVLVLMVRFLPSGLMGLFGGWRPSPRPTRESDNA